MTESDGTTQNMYPQEARLRNLTYSAPLYIDVKKRILSAEGIDDPIEADWRPAIDETGFPSSVEEEKVYIGKVRVSYATPADGSYPSWSVQTSAFFTVSRSK